jgi:hypothetical protein
MTSLERVAVDSGRADVDRDARWVQHELVGVPDLDHVGQHQVRIEQPISPGPSLSLVW